MEQLVLWKQGGQQRLPFSVWSIKKQCIGKQISDFKTKQNKTKKQLANTCEGLSNMLVFCSERKIVANFEQKGGGLWGDLRKHCSKFTWHEKKISRNKEIMSLGKKGIWPYGEHSGCYIPPYT